MNDKQRKAMFAKSGQNARRSTAPASKARRGVRRRIPVGFDGKTVAIASAVGDRWNGWATPRFSHDQAQKAADAYYERTKWRGKSLYGKLDEDAAIMARQEQAIKAGKAQGVNPHVLDEAAAGIERFHADDQTRHIAMISWLKKHADKPAISPETETLIHTSRTWEWEEIKPGQDGLYPVGSQELTWEITGGAIADLDELIANDVIPDEFRDEAQAAVRDHNIKEAEEIMEELEGAGFI